MDPRTRAGVVGEIEESATDFHGSGADSHYERLCGIQWMQACFY
jgi:hypothetical protein